MKEASKAEAYLLGWKNGVQAAASRVESLAEKIANEDLPDSRKPSPAREYAIAILRAAASDLRRDKI